MDSTLSAEVEGLEARLQESRDKLINTWIRTDCAALILENKRKQESSIKRALEELQSHKQNIKKIQDQAVSNNRELEIREKVLQELHRDLQVISCQTESALQTQEALETQKENKMQDLTKRRDLLEHQSKATEKQLMEIEKASSYFTDRLALNIIKCSGNRLQFIFTSIQPNDPEAMCYFFVKIEGEDRHYNVFDCEPPIPDLDFLVEKLNKTNNLKSFVVAVRRHFKDIMCRGN